MYPAPAPARVPRLRVGLVSTDIAAVVRATRVRTALIPVIKKFGHSRRKMERSAPAMPL
jgi:hypothetical protein